jgi:hypothetical protein
MEVLVRDFKFFLTIGVLFLGLCAAAGDLRADVVKPYERVMLIPGGEFRLPAGLGMVAAAIDRGWTPDLIIWSCGFALDGALLNMFTHLYGENPNPKVWREFFHSDKFYQMMKAVTVNEGLFTEKDSRGSTGAQRLLAETTARLAGSFFKKQIPVSIRPKIFKGLDESMVRVEYELAPDGVDRPLATKGIRNLFIATRVLYDASQAGGTRSPDEKLYQETYFTDAITARAIRDQGPELLKSVIAREFPGVPVMADVDVRTGYNAFEVARASLSEPYLTPLMWLRSPENPGVKQPFIAGAMNISPVELALALGKEVMSVQMREAGEFEKIFFQDTSGYKLDDRRAYISSHFRNKVRYWIDLDDAVALESRAGYSPKRIFKLPTIRLENAIPDDQKKFNEMGDEQWEWGFKAVIKAFENPTY